ncbi:MAG: T9SS type A sorting domain-containing protein [Saprospiraceae bacterium]|nr:T9SS type A sorting domain-containing protein [Saprospiraceae bacterium]
MKSVFISTIAIFAQVSYCYSQWIQTDGPYGITNITAIVEHNSLLLISADCGYFSKNQIHNRWELNSTLSFSSFTNKGDSLFVGSMNEGIHLIDLANLSKPPVSINSRPAKTLASSDSCLYLGNATQGFYKSSNYGDTWSSHNIGLPTDTIYHPKIGVYYQTQVTDIALINNYIFCGTKKGVFRNNVSLNNWTSANSGLPLLPPTFVKEFDGTLYTAFSNSLHRSTDLGNNWNLLFTAPSNITSFLKTSFGYYLGTTGDGIYTSIDYGLSWNTINNKLADLHVTAISFFDSTLVCGTNSKGVFYFHGGQWVNNELGMICSNIRSMVCTDSKVFSNDGDHVYTLSNNNSWSDISPNVTNDLFLNLDKMGDTIFITNYYVQPNWPYFFQSIYYSFNLGASWNQISQLPYNSPAGDTWHKIYISGKRIYAYSQEKMYYTDNLGKNWSNISLPGEYCNQFVDFLIFNSTPYAAACGNGQVVKLDNTQNWVLSNNGLPQDREPTALASSEAAFFAHISVHGMYVSFDNGNSWAYANNGLVTNYSIRDFASKGSIVFVTTDCGVFVTNDFGQNWFAINHGLINKNASSIKIFNDTLYVGTIGNGIWKRGISDIHVNVHEHQQSDKSLLVYPNPASEYIYVASAFTNARYKIVDMIGKEVQSGSLSSGIKINISGIQSGAYLVFIQFGKKFQTKKLLISR